MIIKHFSKTGKYCRCTFKLPAGVGSENVHLVGEFNGWSDSEHRMKRLKDGSFSLTLTLPAGRRYRFRYLLDNGKWENDWAADAYVPNVHGSEDSVVQI